MDDVVASLVAQFMPIVSIGFLHGIGFAFVAWLVGAVFVSIRAFFQSGHIRE